MDAPMDLAVIIGTRPEAIKLAPVVLEARRRRLRTAIIASGQQPELVSDTLTCFGLEADLQLPPLPVGNLSARFARLVTRIDRALRKVGPAAVLVQGDTSTAFAGALAAFHLGLPAVHIEAGLRTRLLSEPFPEEGYRQAITRFTTLHCAPTEDAARNLLLEGVAPWCVTITGNTIVDAVRLILRRRGEHPPYVEPPYVVVTAHRRENRGERFATLVDAVETALRMRPDVHWVVMTHPNGWFKRAAAHLEGNARVRFLPPLRYDAFLRLLNGAIAWVSDSGGLQEEACCLRKPLLVCRARTEREEAVEAGWCRVVDPSDPAALTTALERLIFAPWHGTTGARNPFGDGYASRRIVTAVRKLIAGTLRHPHAESLAALRC